MAFLEINNVRIVGISACVPSKRIRSSDDTFVATTGIIERRYDNNYTISDLGIKAANALLSDLNWERGSIGALVVVTQTPDYILPATACILQNKLGFSEECMAMDISLACSGWIYGLCTISSFISTGKGSIKRALLIVGEGRDRVDDNNNLFGHGCSVTALEYTEDPKEYIKFNLGTDGSGFDAIITLDGGSKNGFSPHSFDKYEYDGRQYSRLQPRINGIDVFSFAVSTVPKSINSLVKHYNLNLYDFDYYVLHQANKAINSNIVKKLKLDPSRVPSSIEHFGNTSSASIPLTIVTQLKGCVENCHKKFLCCGFGVGLSWGSVAFETDNIVLSDLVEIGEFE